MEDKIDQLVRMVGKILEKQTEHGQLLMEQAKKIDEIQKHLEYISYKLSEHDREIFILKKGE